jgi:hypothetical protein
VQLAAVTTAKKTDIEFDSMGLRAWELYWLLYRVNKIIVRGVKNANIKGRNIFYCNLVTTRFSAF